MSVRCWFESAEARASAAGLSCVCCDRKQEVVVVKRRRLQTLSAVVSVVAIGCISIILTSTVAAGTNAVNPVDIDTSRDYLGGRVTAGVDDHSSQQWIDALVTQRAKANPNSDPNPCPSQWLPMPSGFGKARQVLELPRASKVLARCRATGMIELPEQAFAILGPGRGSGSDFFVVPMIHPRGDRFAAAMLYREGDGSVIAITVDTATNELIEVISSDGPSDAEDEMTTFDKKKWADCFLASCGPCIAGCAFTGPFWLKCTVACCGVSAAVCAYLAMQE